MLFGPFPHAHIYLGFKALVKCQFSQEVTAVYSHPPDKNQSSSFKPCDTAASFAAPAFF